MPDIFVATKKKETARTKKVTVKRSEAEIKKKKVVDSKVANVLSTFVFKPKNIRFETQEKEEKVVLFLRRHLITNVSWVLLACLLIVAPVFVQRFSLLNFLPERFQFITLLSWYLVTTGYVFKKFLTWFFNVNIITDERIVDIDFPSILYRHISSTKIDQVQDVTIKVGGFARSLLNYGDVSIQTAGAEPEICFEAVPRPEQVSKLLYELILEEEKEKLEGRVR